MKKWILLGTAVLLLSSCTRYVPPEVETSPTVSTSQAPTQLNETLGEPKETDGREAAGDVDRIHIYEETVDQRSEPVKVKGIYVSAYVAGTGDRMDALIEKIDQTEINTVVIDLKDDEGYVTCVTGSEILDGIGSEVAYVSDMKGLIKKLKEHQIYTIARIVTFKDPVLAEKMPELSLKVAEGQIYRDKDGQAWVNPYKQEVWDYLVEVGTYAGELGFDEVQFDYIRFATDRTMKQVVFDEADVKGRSRTDIVSEFTEYAYDRLSPLGLYVSADVFGAIIGNDTDAQAVGQIYGDMAQNLDYICPMIYPSHYGEGNFGLDYPGIHPYETILGALNGSREELAKYEDRGPQAIVRPWLQDFTASYMKHYIKYGPEEIAAQIRAVEDAGYEEWILWNASGRYTWDGLEKMKE